MSKTFGEMRSDAEKIADEELRSRVIRGLGLLKEEYGDDFADHIDPRRLQLSSSSQCVLGQIEGAKYGGDFESAVRRIDGELEEEGANWFGFEMDSEYGYYKLQDAWELVFGVEV